MNGIANRVFAGVLILVALIDFWTRLTLDVDPNKQSSVASNIGQSSSLEQNFVGLSQDDIANAFAWAAKDKPYVKSEPKETSQPQPVVTPPPATPTPVEDPVEKLKKSILGDSTKVIRGENLLVLKGIFFESGYFAVIELTNITTRNVTYHKVRVGEQFGGFTVKSIDKYQINLNVNEQPVVLSLFESDKG